MQTALVQLTTSDDPVTTLPETMGYIAQAAAAGAKFVLTPEVTNCVSSNRDWQNHVLLPEESDQTLAALRAQAHELGIWLLIGSLALKTHDPDGRFANRSFLIDPNGQIIARYDKIHMFDVIVSQTESYHESKGYRPGHRAVVAQTPWAMLGMSICYDLRFPYLYSALAKAGAQILTVPSAFTVPTGTAHWESLLRARAIETGSFVLAPAQVGSHPAQSGPQRRTYGHSLAIDPWGRVLADGGEQPGITLLDLDLSLVTKARLRIPTLSHHVSSIEGPEPS